MNLTRLALRDIAGNAFRSWIIVICAFLVGGITLSTALITRGAEDSLRLAQRRLGADILVVPEGTEQKVEGALLMGSPVKAWMPSSNLAKIQAVPGVAAASPQLYLESLSNASCCSVANMFMVAYDPKTDFTIQPWLMTKIGTGLNLGDAVGGTFVFVPEGEQNIRLYGYILTLKSNLEPTGTNLDQSMFVTFETAEDMASKSKTQAEKPLVIPTDSVSSVLVKVAPGFDSKKVAIDILRAVPGVTPVNSPDLFGTFRGQMDGLRRGMLMVLAVVLILSIALIALIFSMAVHERRREIGVLRALGATQFGVMRSLLLQAAVLALGGGVVGIIISGLVVFFFRNKLVSSLGFPFLFPSLPALLLLVLMGLAIALAGVSLAAFLPAWRVSRQEPAVSMRE